MGQGALDQPLATALFIQAEPRDSPSVLTLARAVGVSPGHKSSVMLAL